uniref:Uncharacterized protein n=1 Tax=Pipistrellus kuhlii TaxID=59472 RepID=A0A7J8B1G8_PIPKU|nr:hypothetical protein mPipKuh1_007701 [Pipistrellus kuhlii]
MQPSPSPAGPPTSPSSVQWTPWEWDPHLNGRKGERKEVGRRDLERPWASDFPCTDGVDWVWQGDKGQGSQSPEVGTSHSSLGLATWMLLTSLTRLSSGGLKASGCTLKRRLGGNLPGTTQHKPGYLLTPPADLLPNKGDGDCLWQ